MQKNYGKPLPRRRFSAKLLKQIFTQYNEIVKLSTSFQPIDSAYNLNYKADLYQKTAENLTTQKSPHAKLLLRFLRKINPETLIFKKSYLRIIHGDFNNNQILLKNGNLSAFKDWESLRTGYPAEDA